MAKQVTGRIFISTNGQRLTSKEGTKLKFGGVKRNTVIANVGIAGFRDEVAAPGIECKVAHYGTTSLQKFRDFKDDTVTFETDTGKVFTLTEAWMEDGRMRRSWKR